MLQVIAGWLSNVSYNLLTQVLDEYLNEKVHVTSYVKMFFIL